MSAPLPTAVLSTLVYHDIFDFPLTISELRQWLYKYYLNNKNINPTLIKLLKDKKIKKKGKFYFLPRKQGLVSVRQNKSKYAVSKLGRAKTWLRAWSILPGLELIGISGNVAMGNAELNDDIDLMFICKKNYLWLCRIVFLFLILLMGKKRRFGKDKAVKDKFCPNLWLDTAALKIKKKNLYTAHEILAIKPIVNKNNAYHSLVKANPWVSDYWPNKYKKILENGEYTVEENKTSPLIVFLNKIAYRIQYFYMKPKITREQISVHSAFFHPVNQSQQVQACFQQKLNQM